MTTAKETRLHHAIRCDAEYQMLLKQCLDAETEYLRIRNSLSPEDQQVLERYLSLCEEMDHRKLVIALTISL